MQQHYFRLLLSLGMIALKPNFAIALTPPQTFLAQNSEPTSTQIIKKNLFQQLNLTRKQQNRIQQIRRRYQGQIAKLKQSLQNSQGQLAIMMAGTDSSTMIREKYQEIAQFRQQLGQLHFESMLAIREVLTPDQRQTFAEIIEAKQ